MKKTAAVPVLRKDQESEKGSIPISRDERFILHDIAEGLRFLRDITEEAPEMRLIQAELLIMKTSRCAWNLIHEELDSRWQESIQMWILFANSKQDGALRSPAKQLLLSKEVCTQAITDSGKPYFG
jgi:hypothetical protein